MRLFSYDSGINYALVVADVNIVWGTKVRTVTQCHPGHKKEVNGPLNK